MGPAVFAWWDAQQHAAARLRSLRVLRSRCASAGLLEAEPTVRFVDGALALVKQEIWSLLLTHYAIRHVMKDAAHTVGTDSDDLSFVRSDRAIRRQVPNRAGFPTDRLADALTETLDEIVAQRLGPRGQRTCPRVV
jgi:hypothetical protein